MIKKSGIMPVPQTPHKNFSQIVQRYLVLPPAGSLRSQAQAFQHDLFTIAPLPKFFLKK
jgi:hypothetical protein